MNKIFPKIVILILLSLIIWPIFVSPASAQNELFFGQNHSYTVIFRGNGEAIVYAKIAITNPDEKPLTEFSFEIPKVSPTEIAMYQMKLPRECVRYDYNSIIPQNGHVWNGAIPTTRKGITPMAMDTERVKLNIKKSNIPNQEISIVSLYQRQSNPINLPLLLLLTQQKVM